MSIQVQMMRFDRFGECYTEQWITITSDITAEQLFADNGEFETEEDAVAWLNECRRRLGFGRKSELKHKWRIIRVDVLKEIS